jgi:hypothetical protein
LGALEDQRPLLGELLFGGWPDLAPEELRKILDQQGKKARRDAEAMQAEEDKLAKASSGVCARAERAAQIPAQFAPSVGDCANRVLA